MRSRVSSISLSDSLLRPCPLHVLLDALGRLTDVGLDVVDGLSGVLLHAIERPRRHAADAAASFRASSSSTAVAATQTSPMMSAASQLSTAPSRARTRNAVSVAQREHRGDRRRDGQAGGLAGVLGLLAHLLARVVHVVAETHGRPLDLVAHGDLGELHLLPHERGDLAAELAEQLADRAAA